MQKPKPSASTFSSSSLVDLKAELLRKQAEFKTEKGQSQNAGYIKGRTATTTKRPSLFSKKNAGVDKRSTKDYEEKVEEENVFERSRKQLDKKAKLYEQMTSGKHVPDEDGSGMFLVDFQKKVIDDVIEKKVQERREREDREKKEVEEEHRLLKEPVPAAEKEEDEWVDYTDSFGRSRRCLRKDLPRHQNQDLKEEDNTSLLSPDMRRELERQRWEKEIQESLQKDAIHYADVQHNEIRTHGVGFYQFSRDESEREEQLERLHTLRNETKDAQSMRERIKEKRKAALAARLEKVKQRRRERAGLTADDDEKDDDRAEVSDEEIGPSVSEMTTEVKKKTEPEPLTRDDTWRSQLPSNREWDKDKEAVLVRSEKKWLETQRNEREQEFAPPSFYYDNKVTQSNKQPVRHKKQAARFQQQVSKETQQKTVVKTECSVSGDVGVEGTSDADQPTQAQTLQASEGFVSSFIKQQLKILRQEVDSSSESPLATVSHHGNTTESTGSKLYSQVPMMQQNVESGYYGTDMSYYSSNPYFEQQADYGPAPNVNMPPPNFNMPPPIFNMPPPNFSVPPTGGQSDFPPMPGPASNTYGEMPHYHPNIHLPPPPPPPPPATTSAPMSQNVQTSLPNINDATVSTPVQPCAAPATSQVYPSAAGYNQYKHTPSSLMTTTPTPASNMGPADNTPGSVDNASVADSRTKFVPKASIIDTRLMMNEDD